jgi:hypothetical protein
LKEFLIFFEGNSGQKKEKIRKLPSSEMEALIICKIEPDRRLREARKNYCKMEDIFVKPTFIGR